MVFQGIPNKSIAQIFTFWNKNWTFTEKVKTGYHIRYMVRIVIKKRIRLFYESDTLPFEKSEIIKKYDFVNFDVLCSPQKLHKTFQFIICN